MAHYTAKFWKPGTEAPGEALKEERDSEPAAVAYNPYIALSIQQQREKLPVFKYRNSILYLLENFQTTIIVGETGSGKSTQIPQYLLEVGWANHGRKIAVTQPRRVSAVTVASRVAEERGCQLGDVIGYKIRFDSCLDEGKTRVKFLTDGMLIREIMQDPLLREYSVIMLDEVHERTIHTDLLIGFLKKIMKKRPELKLIVSSATMDAQHFYNYFTSFERDDKLKATAAILSVEGRMYPVDIFYTIDPVAHYVKATVDAVLKIHASESAGDILAFLTGVEEIEHVISTLIEESRRQVTGDRQQLLVLPMHSGLPHAYQMKVFQRTPQGFRKVIVATNIAEASVTIPGVVYVVDCGFVKIKAYNPDTAIESLLIVPTSKASAIQRSGRAGRIRSGKAYRLYTEEEYRKLADATVPELQRSDLAPVVLQMKALGIDNVVRFSFLSPPPAQNMVRGVELLYALGALDKSAYLTRPLGHQMAEFPLHPMFAKMLLSSGDMKCSEEILTITSMTQIQNIFVTPPNQKIKADKKKRLFGVEEGDHITLLNVYLAFIKYNKNPKWCHTNYLNYKGLLRALTIRDQLKSLLVRYGVPLISCEGDVDTIRKCITLGFFANAARLHFIGHGVYRTVRDNHELYIHPTSVLHRDVPPQWVVFNEVVKTDKEYMQDVTVIDPQWLYELAPHFYEFGTVREKAIKHARTSGD